MSGRGGAARVPVSWGSPRFRTRSVGPFEVTDAYFPADAVLEQHHHDRTVVAVTLSGAIESRLGSRSLLGRRDDVWTEPVCDAHSNRVGPDGARVLVIQPDPAREDLLEPCSTLLDRVHHFRHGGVSLLARSLLPELEFEDGCDALMIEALVLQILATATRGTAPSESARAWLDQALERIHDGFLERLTVAGIADEIGLDPGYFTQAFRNKTGVTVGRYVRRLRLDWAAAQLRTTDEPIGLIALRARFSDQSHFTRELKRHTGKTPGEYRRAFKS